MKTNKAIEIENMKMGLLARGFLSMSSSYDGVPFSIDQETLESNPDKYVIRECLDACKILWAKNIFTYLTSDYLDSNAYIEIKLEDLSEENLDVITSLKKPFFKKRGKNNSIILGIHKVGEVARTKLIELANRFSIQPLPERGYISLEEALCICGCSRLIKNSKYINEEEIKKQKNILSPNAYLDLYLNYQNSTVSKKRIYIFDPLKVPDSYDNLLEKNGFVQDLTANKIYRSRFYFSKQLQFLKEKARVEATLKKEI